MTSENRDVKQISDLYNTLAYWYVQCPYSTVRVYICLQITMDYTTGIEITIYSDIVPV